MAETVVPIPGPETIVLSLNDITAVGPPGPQGPTGLTGALGPTGPTGPPLQMKGSVASHANLPASGNVVGDLWITSDTGHAWSWNGTAWIDCGPFIGPPGPQGVAGPTGTPGTAATITAGTTTTGAPGTQASVINSGTATTAVFNFAIPQGLQGVAGPTGPQGPVGTAGISTDAGNLATLGSDSQILVPTSSITNIRLRSYNALGNPNFTCDQINCGSAFTLTASGQTSKTIDRWLSSIFGTLRISVQQMSGLVTIPGTSYTITNRFCRITITTAQATLAATDYVGLYQMLEGIQFREMFSDVHSVNILCRSSVANLKFGISINDAPETQALAKLCTLGAANTWTLLSYSNLPVFPPSGNWGGSPGVSSQQLNIMLAAGSGQLVAANDVWQASTGAWAPIGMSNFAATAGATFDLAFIQWEPGPNCTQLIDKPFSQNLDECQRYFNTNYPAGIKPGATSTGGYLQYTPANADPWGSWLFPKRMAKTPTVIIYSPNTGAANNVRDSYASVDRAVSGLPGVIDNSYSGITLSAHNTNATYYNWMHTADTGW